MDCIKSIFICSRSGIGETGIGTSNIDGKSGHALISSGVLISFEIVSKSFGKVSDSSMPATNSFRIVLDIFGINADSIGIGPESFRIDPDSFETTLDSSVIILDSFCYCAVLGLHR